MEFKILPPDSSVAAAFTLTGCAGLGHTLKKLSERSASHRSTLKFGL
jgi:hypothetical protein